MVNASLTFKNIGRELLAINREEKSGGKSLPVKNTKIVIFWCWGAYHRILAYRYHTRGSVQIITYLYIWKTYLPKICWNLYIKLQSGPKKILAYKCSL